MEAEALYGVRLSELFSLSGAVALPCWLLLLVAPRWRWSELLATFAAPLLIAALYILLLALHRVPPGSGFGSLSLAGKCTVPIALCTTCRMDPLCGFRSLYRSMASMRRKAGWDF